MAIEHRDGTGPFVLTRTPIPGLKEELPPNCKMYLNPDDVTSELLLHGDYQHTLTLRLTGLMRPYTINLHLEKTSCYIAASSCTRPTSISSSSCHLHGVQVSLTMRHLMSGRLTLRAEPPSLDWLHTVDGPWTHDLPSRPSDQTFWQSWLTAPGTPPKIECDHDVLLTGHSFGGATLVRTSFSSFSTTG